MPSQKKGETYTTLLKIYNVNKRPKSPRMMCECGKEIFVSQMERHKTTKLHQVLLDKLQLYKSQLENREEAKKKEAEELRLYILQLQEKLKTIEN